MVWCFSAVSQLPIPECFQLGILRRLKGQVNIDSAAAAAAALLLHSKTCMSGMSPQECEIFKQHLEVVRIFQIYPVLFLCYFVLDLVFSC